MAQLNILIVDDDRDIADTLAFIIRHSGYNVNVAYSGEQAVELADKEEFDIAFIDLMLPNMDGPACLEGLRKRHPGIRAHMMTGYSTRDHQDRAVTAGALSILRKPVMPEDILGKLCESNPGTILIADDDPIFAEIVSNTLQTAGWNVRRTETGLQTVDVAARGGIDAIVLDYAMPACNGVEVCAELDRRGIKVPIIVATSNPHCKEMFEAKGINQFLSKPVDPRAVLDFVMKSTKRAPRVAA